MDRSPLTKAEATELHRGLLLFIEDGGELPNEWFSVSGHP
jgi:hypothetical protein